MLFSTGFREKANSVKKKQPSSPTQNAIVFRVILIMRLSLMVKLGSKLERQKQYKDSTLGNTQLMRIALGGKI